MSEADDRLRKLVAQSRDVDDCCDEDVDERLSQLRELRDSSAEGLDEDVEVLSALANGTRYSVVRLLVEADEELCVCEITPLFDVSESAVSHALAELSEAGLV
ncbi:MAG: metalloregulator ArsR/SmtB family transcription factor, partial [Halobacteria archaeon]|nr:metalloregulator ArsR/SmtB family transcription factor [Halobacteria archaeon]